MCRPRVVRRRLLSGSAAFFAIIATVGCTNSGSTAGDSSAPAPTDSPTQTTTEVRAGAAERFAACLNNAGIRTQLGEPSPPGTPQDARRDGMVLVLVFEGPNPPEESRLDWDAWFAGTSPGSPYAGLNLDMNNIVASSEYMLETGTTLWLAVPSAAAFQAADDQELYEAYSACEVEHPDFTQPNPRAGIDTEESLAAWRQANDNSIAFAACGRAAGFHQLADPDPEGGVVIPDTMTAAALSQLLVDCLPDNPAQMIALEHPQAGFDWVWEVLENYPNRVISIIR